VVKVGEIAKGNINSVAGQSLEETLNNHLNLFSRQLQGQPMFSQQGYETDQENQQEMLRANPAGSSGGSRYKSANEQRVVAMRTSTRRTASCALCLCPGHKVGRKCQVVLDLEATVITSNETASFANSLGNPAKVLVEEPAEEIKQAIMKWTSPCVEIPVAAKHILFKRCFYAASRQESFMCNIVEVFVLEEAVQELPGYCPSYFPVYETLQWIKRYCNSRHRKRVLLSSLSQPEEILSQALYEYSS